MLTGRNIPSYAQLERLILDAQITTRPEHAHGLLCAILCADEEVTIEVWLQQLALQIEDNEVVHLVNETSIYQLYHATEQQLEALTFDFKLFIPDEEDASLRTRVNGLAIWAKSYLDGLAQYGLDLQADSYEEIHHVIRDLSQIAELDSAADQLSVEDDEDAFTVVSEYVRMAVLMVYTEIRQQVRSGPVPVDSGTLH